MKPELIAEWRQRVKDRTLITLPVTAIERILEERDKLLTALREFTNYCDCHLTHTSPPCEHERGRDTIAYAEAE